MNGFDARALLALYGGAHGPWGPTMIVLTVIGGGWAVAALLPMLFIARTRGFASSLAAAIALQAVLVWAIKGVVGRVRPWIALGLPAPLGAPHDGSFPSGHSAGSFCVAVFVAMALPAVWPEAGVRSRAVGAMGLVVAAGVALSRVYLGAHFPSDVAAGALLGALIGGAAGWRFAEATRSARERLD